MRCQVADAEDLEKDQGMAARKKRDPAWQLVTANAIHKIAIEIAEI